MMPANEHATTAYKGAAPFSDTATDRALFFGRDEDGRRLLSLMMSSPITLLFGKSGLGKTSLINAFLLEQLRKRRFLPIVVRLKERTYGENKIGMTEFLLQQIEVRLAAAKVRLESYDQLHMQIRTLWTYFMSHRFIREESSDGQQKFEEMTPVLIFDQFEELFTYLDRDDREVVEGEVATLVGRRVPEAVRSYCEMEIEKVGQEPPAVRRLMDILYGKCISDLKILFSIREDYLPFVQEIRRAIPNIFSATFRIEPLTLDQARQAIEGPASQSEVLGDGTFEYGPGAVEDMLRFLSNEKSNTDNQSAGRVEAFELQILCYSLDEQRRLQSSKKIGIADLHGDLGMQKIISNYYDKVIKKFPSLHIDLGDGQWKFRAGWYLVATSRRRAIRALCERGLILRSGHRNSLAASVIVDDFGVTIDELQKLVDERLLRVDKRLGTEFYELSHDTLVRSIRDTAKRLRMHGQLTKLAVVAIAILGIAGGYQVARWVRAGDIQDLQALVLNSRASLEARNAALTNLVDLTGGVVEFSGRFRVLADFGLNGLQTRGVRRFVFDGGTLSDANFAELWMTRATFSIAVLRRANFTGSTLSAADFSGATVDGSCFVRARMSAVQFVGARIGLNTVRDGQRGGDERSGVREIECVVAQARVGQSAGRDRWFAAASLEGANFQGAQLRGVSFSQATLVSAVFDGAMLSSVDLSSSDLTGADFSNVSADFSSGNLEASINLQGTAWWLATGWTDAQVDVLLARFPPTGIRSSERYTEPLARLAAAANEAQSRMRDSAGMTIFAARLNALAWHRAIHGVDLDIAEQEIVSSLAIDETWAALDTYAYILMQRRKLREAAAAFRHAYQLMNDARTSWSVPEPARSRILYRFARCLELLGEDSESRTYYAQVRDYRPTHERALIATLSASPR